jgi:hypothetical protein
VVSRLKTTVHFIFSTFEAMVDGGVHEETEKNESFEGRFEKEKCQAFLEKV